MIFITGLPSEWKKILFQFLWLRKKITDEWFYVRAIPTDRPSNNVRLLFVKIMAMANKNYKKTDCVRENKSQSRIKCLWIYLLFFAVVAFFFSRFFEINFFFFLLMSNWTMKNLKTSLTGFNYATLLFWRNGNVMCVHFSFIRLHYKWKMMKFLHMYLVLMCLVHGSSFSVCDQTLFLWINNI